jgi:ABC-type uncharacterized transport system permease subunit
MGILRPMQLYHIQVEAVRESEVDHHNWQEVFMVVGVEVPMQQYTRQMMELTVMVVVVVVETTLLHTRMVAGEEALAAS